MLPKGLKYLPILAILSGTAGAHDYQELRLDIPPQGQRQLVEAGFRPDPGLLGEAPLPYFVFMESLLLLTRQYDQDSREPARHSHLDSGTGTALGRLETALRTAGLEDR